MKNSKPSKFFEPLAVQVSAGYSIRAAADVIGCALQTAYNISASHEFKQRVAEIRSEITYQAVGRLADSASLAVDTLRELTDAANEPSIRLNASKAILAALPTMTEFGELRARVDAIESGSTKPRLAQ
jgi:hypothetical protein